MKHAFAIFALIGSVIFTQGILVNLVVVLLLWLSIRFIIHNFFSRSRLCIRKVPNYFFNIVSCTGFELSWIIVILHFLDTIVLDIYVMNMLLLCSDLSIIVLLNAVLLFSLWLASIFIDLELMYLIINLFEL